MVVVLTQGMSGYKLDSPSILNRSSSCNIYRWIIFKPFTRGPGVLENNNPNQSRKFEYKNLFQYVNLKNFDNITCFLNSC